MAHPRRARLLLLAVCAAIACPTAARAGDLYAAGPLAITGAHGSSGGSTDFFANTGSDSDSSPTFGPALGYEFPLAELLPRDWDSPLPSWPVRFEFEGVFGRDYELVTQGGDPYLSRVSSWAVYHNLALDLPMHGAVSWAVGRVPLIEPLSFSLLAGVGLGSTDVETSNNVLSGGDDSLGFSWQAGAGFAYRLTDRVSVDFGYRFVDLGDFRFTLRSPPQEEPLGSFALDLVSHEFKAGLRLRFYSAASPGDWSFRRDR
jgi:opacity protein-like surface antigen